MSFRMKYNIKKDYLRKGSKKRPGNAIKPRFVVAHDTGNPGSTAQGNVNYYKRVQDESYASAHLFVDDKNIIECIPALTGTPERAFHVIYNVTTDNRMYGDDANDIAIGVELCFGGKINGEEAYKRYVWLIAYICYKFGLSPAKAIVGHKILDPGRKIDPHNGLSKIGKSYDQLLTDIVKEYYECLEKNEPNEKNLPVKVGSNTYKIEKGDTFWSIANMFGLDVRDLMDLNPKLNPKNLKVGQTVYLKKHTNYRTHKIERGDTLIRIARSYGVSVDEIYQLNKGIEPRQLQIGQIIQIPSSTRLEVPTSIRPYPGKPLKRGSRGRDVEAVQRALGFSGHAVDGIFGKNTENAVAAYQKRHGLESDGIVGPKTWDVLF